MATPEKKWLVFYTKSRQEKAATEFLRRRGFEVFLPLQKVVRQWSDRKKKVEVPLFNSYIFVLDTLDQIPAILQTPGIAWNIRHNDRPAELQLSEIQTIKRFLESGFLLDSAPTVDFQRGEMVEVVDGALRGVTGRFLSTGNDGSLWVDLSSINQSLHVTLPAAAVRKIKSK